MRSVLTFVIITLLLFVAVGLALIFFGVRMADYRATQRALGVPVEGLVVDVETRQVTHEDEDGTWTSTEYKYLIELEADGTKVQRPLLAANFEPDDVWFNEDEVDPYEFADGEIVDVLVRRDLDHAISPASFWAAYLIPAILIGFGSFVVLFLGLWSWLAFGSPFKHRHAR